jgi:hypothetical protein
MSIFFIKSRTPFDDFRVSRTAPNNWPYEGGGIFCSNVASSYVGSWPLCDVDATATGLAVDEWVTLITLTLTFSVEL